MKRIVKYYWQLLVFFVLYIPYNILNVKVIVNWLGCGCPRVDEQGNTVENVFNANDFTLIFWNVIALLVIIISIFNLRDITRWCLKIFYILSIILISAFIAMSFFYSMQWN